MSEFKPFESEPCYKVVLSKDEALLIQKIRSTGYGSITVHIVNNKVIRTETVSSELTKDRNKESVTIAYEVVNL